MVAVPYRPTLWVASASHLTDWRAGSAEYLYIRPANPKLAKKASSSTPEGLGATHYRACTHATVQVCRRIAQRDKPRRATTPVIVFAVGGGADRYTTA